MNAAHLALFAVATLALGFAVIGYAVYIYQVSEALKMQTPPRLPRNAYNWYIASGSLFIIGLLIFAFFAFWQFQAIRLCNVATGQPRSASLFQGTTIWLVGVVFFVIAVACFVATSQVLVPELTTNIDNGNFILASFTGALFLAVTLILLGGTWFGLRTDLRICRERPVTAFAAAIDDLAIL